MTADKRVNIVRERMANQFLTVPGPQLASDVVRQLGAVQAQDYAGAKWALSQRAHDATDAAIENELTLGRILRTHVLRPTWHFVTPEDIRWMLALTAPRVAARMAPYNRKLELTPQVFRRCNDAIATALGDGKHLTRADLRAILERKRVSIIAPQRLGHIMMQAELDAVVCSGPRKGKQFTYALLDERAAAAKPLDADEALSELTRRYFLTRSPATTHDFAWWSGLTMNDARRGIDICRPDLEQITIDDRQYLFTRRETAAPSELRTVHLLPNYDEYFIGFKNRSAIGRRLRDLDLVTGGDALMAHIVFVDGQIVGGWKRSNGKGATGLDFSLLAPLSGAERKRLNAAVARFGRFLGVTEAPRRV